MIMEWYPFYPQLYRSDTYLLDPYQDGCYRRLIDHYMESRRPLPLQDVALARIIGISESDWLEKASAVVKPYFKTTKEGLRHKRCDLELDAQDRRAKKRSEISKKGVEARKKKRQSKQQVDNQRLTGGERAVEPDVNYRTGQDRTIIPPDSLTNARGDETFTYQDALAAIGVQHDPNWAVRTSDVWDSWIRQGATPAQIMRAITEVMGRREHPPGNMLYFGKAVKDVMAYDKSLTLNFEEGAEPHAKPSNRSPRRRTSDTRMAVLAAGRAKIG